MVRPWISLFDAEKKKQWQEEGGMLNSSSRSGYPHMLWFLIMGKEGV